MHKRSFQSGILAVVLELELGLNGVFFIRGAEVVGELVGTVGIGLETVVIDFDTVGVADGAIVGGVETVVIDFDTVGVADGTIVGGVETPGAGGEIAGVGVEATGCGVDATGALVDVDRRTVVLTGGFVAGGLLSKFDNIPGTAAMPFERRSSRGFF